MHEKKGYLGITFRNKCPKNKHHMSKNDYSTSYRDGLKQKIIDTALPLFKENGIKAVKMDACHPLSNSNFLHATIAILHDIQPLGWSRQSLTIY